MWAWLFFCFFIVCLLIRAVPGFRTALFLCFTAPVAYFLVAKGTEYDLWETGD